MLRIASFGEKVDQKKFHKILPSPPGMTQGAGGDVWRLFCRKVCRKNSVSVDGGLSRGSRVNGHGSEDPIGASGIFTHLHIHTYMHLHIYTFMHLHISFTHLHINAFTHLHIYTCIHLHIYTFTHRHSYKFHINTFTHHFSIPLFSLKIRWCDRL